MSSRMTVDELMILRKFQRLAPSEKTLIERCADNHLRFGTFFLEREYCLDCFNRHACTDRHQNFALTRCKFLLR
jgi:hypothetical protein